MSRYMKMCLERHNGHASAISYVNDDKYNFHGVLEFDPTWDSKNG